MQPESIDATPAAARQVGYIDRWPIPLSWPQSLHPLRRLPDIRVPFSGTKCKISNQSSLCRSVCASEHFCLRLHVVEKLEEQITRTRQKRLLAEAT
jgi:hypothetical protein